MEELWFAAALFGLLPLLNTLTTERHLLNSIATRDWVFAGFDLTMLATGIVFAYAAIKLRRRADASPSLAAKKNISRKGSDPLLLTQEAIQ